MGELSKDEIWFIQVYFERRGFYGAHNISDIDLHMMRIYSFHRSQDIISSLLKKRVLGISPDKTEVKFTDYGLELF